MARAHAVLDEGRDRRQLHDGLRDPAARVGEEAEAELGELGARGIRTDDQALAARAVDGLHHELVEPVEHLGERGGLLEPPGVDVGEDRLLAEEVADEVGHVGVDELVVGDAVADRVRDRDVPEAGGEHEPGRAEHRVGPELLRVEELVVDAAVDHVDAGGTGGRAHPHAPAGAEQVAALDELDAHEPREQGVLVVRGVVDAGRQHDDGRILDALGRARAQRLQQAVRVVADRPHPHRREQLGQGLRHDAAVRDDVAHAARHAHVVLEHPPGAELVADDVDAGDVHAHAVGADDAGGLPVVVGRRADQRRGDHPVAHRVLRAVHVGEEPLERAHPLRDARLDDAPVGCRDDPRHGVEREGALLAREVEGDALREVRARQRVGASAELVLRHPREGRIELAVRLAHRPGFGGEHLVPRTGGALPLPPRPRRGVPVEERSHGLTVPVVGYRDVTDTRRARHPSAWPNFP